MEPKIEQKFCSTSEVARALSLSKSMINKLLKTGEIPHRRFGRAVRIPMAWLQEQAGMVEK